MTMRLPVLANGVTTAVLWQETRLILTYLHVFESTGEADARHI